MSSINTKPLFPFSEWLKEQLCITGMSQGRLALEAGISQGQICRYISGKVEPRISSVERILNVYGYTLKDVIVC